MAGLREKVGHLDHKLDSKRKLFFRYFLSYSRSHHIMCWEIKEADLLLKAHELSSYIVWKLNEELYRYSESSISALNWLYPERKDHPFVHQYLRAWRNEWQHESKQDFRLCDIDFEINGERQNYQNNFYAKAIFSERIKNVLRKQFGTEFVATNATIGGLILYHHIYMMSAFSGFEENMNKEMPSKYLISSNIHKTSISVGGKYEKLYSEDEFWNPEK